MGNRSHLEKCRSDVAVNECLKPVKSLHNDKFKAEIIDNTHNDWPAVDKYLKVTAKDFTGGWGQNLVLPLNKGNVTVGDSSSNVKYTFKRNRLGNN